MPGHLRHGCGTRPVLEDSSGPPRVPLDHFSLERYDDYTNETPLGHDPEDGRVPFFDGTADLHTASKVPPWALSFQVVTIEGGFGPGLDGFIRAESSRSQLAGAWSDL